MQTLAKGDRVKHPTMDEWGVGEVLKDSDGSTVEIFFVGAGRKTLSLNYVVPTKLTLGESFHPLLDNLKLDSTSDAIKYQSLPESIQFFLQEFPEGFYDSKYHEHERDYKDKAHQLSRELLNEAEFHNLIEQNNYDEIIKRTLKIVNCTNLIFPNEKMALKDGLSTSDAKETFTKRLYNLLYGNDDLASRFEIFSKILSTIGADKWTVASYFLFLFKPDEFMFVKPTVIQHASDLCRFEINYKPQLNWLTYKSIMDFSSYLYKELKLLNPRDMIDVQSFMWCVAPGKY